MGLMLRHIEVPWLPDRPVEPGDDSNMIDGRVGGPSLKHSKGTSLEAF
jgi:hypothetical protein